MEFWQHLNLTVAVSIVSFEIKFQNVTVVWRDLSGAIGFYDFTVSMFYCRCNSFECHNSPKFQFVKSQKLSDLCSKIYETSPNLGAAK